MESSEQCAYDNSLDPEDLSGTESKVVITKYDGEYQTVTEGDDDELANQPVVGYLEVHRENDTAGDLTLILPPGFYCSDNGNEIYLMVNEQDQPIEQSFSQGSVIHPTVKFENGIKRDMDIPDGVSQEELIETVEISQNISKGESVFIENQNLNSDDNSSVDNHETVQYQVQVKNDDTEMVFIPSLSLMPGASVVVPQEETKHRKLMQLAEIAHELQSADITTSSSSEHANDLESSNVQIEESVIVSQKHIDSGLTITLANSLDNETEVTVSACEVDEGVSEKNECPHFEGSSHPIENATHIVHSFISSSSSRPIDNAVSVIHAVSSKYGEEKRSRKNVIDSVNCGDVSSENPLVADKFQHTPQEYIESVCQDGSHHSFVVNEGLDTVNTELSNHDEDSVSHDSCLNLTKEIQNNQLHGDDTSLTSEGEKTRYLTESYNDGDLHCNEASDCGEERMEEDSNHSVGVSSRSSHVGNESKDEHLSNNSSSHNAECSETDIDNKMDVDHDISNTEDETLTSRVSEKELQVSVDVLSETSSGLKITVEPESVNAHQKVLEEGQSLPLPKKVLNSNNYEDAPNASFSEDSQQSRSLVTEKSSMNSRKYKKKSKSNAYTFKTSSNNSNRNISQSSCAYSEASLAEDEMDSEPSNAKIDSLTACDKNITQKLTFLGALDSTMNNEAGLDHSNNAFEQTVEEHKSSATFGSGDESKSVCNSISSATEKQINLNGNSVETRSFTECVGNKGPLDKEVDGITEASNMEETSVKVPKKTYLMKRRSNLSKINDKEKIDFVSSKGIAFSSLKDSETPFPAGSDNQTSSLHEDATPEAKEADFEDDFISDVQSRVSATYLKKRKSKPTIVQQIRTQSLRPRYSHSSESLENGPARTEEILNEIAKKEAKKDEESVYWGDYLSRTSFQTVQNSDPPASTSRKKKLTSCPERGRLRWFKNSVKSGKQWEKLIKSSPHKVKRLGTEKRKLREKVKKQSMSLLNSKNFNPRLSKSSPAKKRGRPKKVVTPRATSSVGTKCVKKSGIRFLCGPNEQPCSELPDSGMTVSSSILNPDHLFNCFNCSFGSSKVNNLISHMTYCCKRHTSGIIDYTVNDMARRQRIRGEDLRDDVEPESSNAFKDSISQDSDDEDIYRDPNKITNTNIFKPKEIVWAEVKKRFWPALLWELDNDMALVYLITSPSANEGLKISVKRLESFDDLERNKKYMAQAKSHPNSSSFVKAVQMSNSYARKRLLLDNEIDAKDFFKIPKDVKFLSDNESSDSSIFIEELLDSSDEINDSQSSEKLDDSEFDMEFSGITEVMNSILKGKCNEHLLAIFHNKTASERHQMHINKDPGTANRLKDMSWFGPFNSDPTMQLQLYDYFYELFKKKIGDSYSKGKEDMISYIYEVWIPEAIIKAISIVKDTTLDEAEIIFYKQETKNNFVIMEELDS